MLMPGFDREIARVAQRLLIQGRPIDYHTGVLATKVRWSRPRPSWCARFAREQPSAPSRPRRVFARRARFFSPAGCHAAPRSTGLAPLPAAALACLCSSRRGASAVQAQVTPGVPGVKPVTIELTDFKTKKVVDTLEVDAVLVATGR